MNWRSPSPYVVAVVTLPGVFLQRLTYEKSSTLSINLSLRHMTPAIGVSWAGWHSFSYEGIWRKNNYKKSYFSRKTMPIHTQPTPKSNDTRIMSRSPRISWRLWIVAAINSACFIAASLTTLCGCGHISYLIFFTAPHILHFRSFSMFRMLNLWGRHSFFFCSSA